MHCFTFYLLFDVDVMKVLKLRVGAASPKQYRLSAKHIKNTWGVKITEAKQHFTRASVANFKTVFMVCKGNNFSI